MQELEQMIKIYHTAFIVFLVLSIIFLVISVALFFLFDIRGIFDMKSGRGAKKAIQKMQELNDQTGKLRQDVITNTPVSLNAENRISAPPTEKRMDAAMYAGNAAVSVNTGSQETELLDEGSRETTLLSPAQTEETPQSEAKKLPGAFHIEKEIMWIHTEEML